MKYKEIDNLIGKTKNEIIEQLGDEFNYYRSSIWTYLILKSWYKKKILFIFFNKKDCVYKIQVKNEYFFW